MNWIIEYKKSLKNLHAEEPLDVYLYRPFAFVIVKLFYSLPITPNQYSLAALLAGVASGYNFLKGDSLSFKWGAFFFLLFAILDCCDGMVARLKKNGTKYGRIIDGLVDYLVNAIVYITLAIGIKKQFSPDLLQPWVLVLLAGLTKAIHAFFYDHYLNEYMSYEKGNRGFASREIEEVKQRLVESENSNDLFIKRFALRIYLKYSLVQAGNNKNDLSIDPKSYCEKNLKALKMWSMIGPSAHITFFVLACFLNEPYLLFFYTVIAGNIWLLLMLFYQFKNNQELAGERTA